MTERQSSGDVRRALETVDLDSLGVELKTLLLVGEELQDVLALVALELDDLAHLGVVHNGSIAGCECERSARVVRRDDQIVAVTHQISS